MKKLRILIFLILILSSFLARQVFCSTDFRLKILTIPQCNDGKDNDLDGFIDFPLDKDCKSRFDNSESPGNYGNQVSTINFSGLAFPLAKIKILRDSQVISEFIAKNNGKFDFNIYGLYSGIYNFGIVAEDEQQRKTSLYNFSLYINRGSQTIIENFFLSPTLELNKLEFEKGEKIDLSGKSLKKTEIKIFLENENNDLIKEILTETDNNGDYNHKIDTHEYQNGKYKIYLKALDKHGNESLNSKTFFFDLVQKPINNSENIMHKIPCDVNGDNNVNIIDFSILLYWWDKGYRKDVDFNNDGKINIIDFSIMSFYWTG